jgi:hypothetical protein
VRFSAREVQEQHILGKVHVKTFLAFYKKVEGVFGGHFFPPWICFPAVSLHEKPKKHDKYISDSKNKNVLGQKKKQVGS